MADAYDLFVISMVMPIMSYLYNQGTNDSSLISTAALIGAACGQLIFGLLADQIGRRISFIVTVSIIIMAAIASSLIFDVNGSIYYLLFVVRLFLGFGIGGEYPLSASIASETSAEGDENARKKRGRNVAMVFSMQGFGNVLSTIVVLILLEITTDLVCFIFHH